MKYSVWSERSPARWSSSRKLGLICPDGKSCHPTSATRLPRSASSGSPTYDHSAVVRTSTNCASASRSSASQVWADDTFSTIAFSSAAKLPVSGLRRNVRQASPFDSRTSSQTSSTAISPAPASVRKARCSESSAV